MQLKTILKKQSKFSWGGDCWCWEVWVCSGREETEILPANIHYGFVLIHKKVFKKTLKMFPVSLVLHTHCQGVADDCTVREGPPVMDPWLWKWMRKLEMTVMNSERFLWKTFKLCTASHHSRSLTTVMKATAPPTASPGAVQSFSWQHEWMVQDGKTGCVSWMHVFSACIPLSD